jgi:hypothetical protein
MLYARPSDWSSDVCSSDLRIIVAAYCSSVEDEEPSSFGQSFIGQDVCGSKYNDDPFDAAKGKGSAWQDFQLRVREKEAADLAAATNITKVDALKTHRVEGETGTWKVALTNSKRRSIKKHAKDTNQNYFTTISSPTSQFLADFSAE